MLTQPRKAVADQAGGLPAPAGTESTSAPFSVSPGVGTQILPEDVRPWLDPSATHALHNAPALQKTESMPGSGLRWGADHIQSAHLGVRATEVG